MHTQGGEAAELPGGTDASLQQQTRCPETKALATLEAQRRGRG